MGTPGYMSPEQCRGEEVDMRSDLYAIAVILYRCITGRLPFEDTSPMTLLFKHAHEPPPDPSSVTEREIRPETREMLLRGLAKQPDDRFASAVEMRNCLETLRKSLPVRPGNPEHLLTDIVAFVMGPRPARPESAPFEIDDLGDEATRGRTQNYAARMELNRAQVLMPELPEPEKTQKNLPNSAQPAAAVAVVAVAPAPPAAQTLPPKLQRLQHVGMALGVLAVLIGVALGSIGGKAATTQTNLAPTSQPTRVAAPAPAPVAAAAAPQPAPEKRVEPAPEMPTAAQRAQILANQAKMAEPNVAAALLTQAIALDPSNAEYAERLTKIRQPVAQAVAAPADAHKAAHAQPLATKDNAVPHADKPVAAEQPRGHVQPHLME